MHWKKCRADSEFIGAWDLEDEAGNPKEFTLKILKAGPEIVKNREHPKGIRMPVVRFEGARKGLIINSTNGGAIESMYGPQVEAWAGKAITLYKAKTRGPSGKMIDCVRVKPKRPDGEPEVLGGREASPEELAALEEEYRGRE